MLRLSRMLHRAAYPLLAVFLLPLIAPPVAAQAAGADAVVGLWKTTPTDKGYAHVRITKVGDTYRGEIVALDNPNFPAGDPMAGKPKIDRENPDPALKNRPILGLPLMEGFRFQGDNLWEDGTIYDPENGKTYACKMWLEGETLRVRGFIGISLLGRTTAWTRLADNP